MPAAVASMHGDAEFLPVDAVGPAIQILFDALKKRSPGKSPAMKETEHFQQMMCELTAGLLSQGYTLYEGTATAEQLAWLDDLVRRTGAARVVEVGFNAGFSSYAFLAAGPHVEVVSFDLGEHRCVALAKRIIDGRFPGRHTLVFGDSRQTVPAFAAAKPRKFDLVFVDGGHSYDVARADLTNLQSLAAPGASLVIDDLMPWRLGRGRHAPGRTPSARAWSDRLPSSRTAVPSRHPRRRASACGRWARTTSGSSFAYPPG